MKRTITGLASTTSAAADDFLPPGMYLVRIKRLVYHYQRQKPFYLVRLAVLEPAAFRQRSISGRLWCIPKALWKLTWFLRAFGYDASLLRADQIDEHDAVGLRGAVKISTVTRSGHAYTNLEAFAPAESWAEFAQSAEPAVAR